MIMSATVVLPTDVSQITTHQTIIKVGESLRQKQEFAAEEAKHKAILCTEEVIRREETQKREQELAKTKEEWKRERQQIFQEAHHNQLRAIKRQTTILEEKLKKEFAATLAKAEEQHKKNLERTVQKIWEEANQVRERAVSDARKDEQEIAREEAKRVAGRVAEEKAIAKETAAEELQLALEKQREFLKQLHREALTNQCKELELKFHAILSEESSKHAVELAKMEQQYSEQVNTTERVEGELKRMTELKEQWEEKYRNLKLEFSDFIDQFPGFKGEFLLK